MKEEEVTMEQKIEKEAMTESKMDEDEAMQILAIAFTYDTKVFNDIFMERVEAAKETLKANRINISKEKVWSLIDAYIEDILSHAAIGRVPLWTEFRANCYGLTLMPNQNFAKDKVEIEMAHICNAIKKVARKSKMKEDVAARIFAIVRSIEPNGFTFSEEFKKSIKTAERILGASPVFPPSSIEVSHMIHMYEDDIDWCLERGYLPTWVKILTNNPYLIPTSEFVPASDFVKKKVSELCG